MVELESGAYARQRGQWCGWPSVLVRRGVRAALLVVCSLGWLPWPPARAQGVQAGPPAAGCTAREIGRSTLVADSLAIYVEPSAFVVSGHETLLAGKPVYAWRRTPDGTPQLVSGDSILGTVIARDGSAHIVYAPIPHGNRIIGVRAAARSGGGWDVVFAELTAPYDGMHDGTVAHLWYGTYVDARWRQIDSIAIPEDRVPHPFEASALVPAGDTLLWAMPVTPSDTAGWDRSTLVFERSGGRWSTTALATDGLSTVTAAHSDRDGFVLALSHPDTRIPKYGTSIASSLMLYGWHDGWRLLGRAVNGDSLNVYLKSALAVSDRWLLTWFVVQHNPLEARREARALAGQQVVPDGHWVVLDPNMNYVAPPVLIDGTPVWAIEHLVPILLDPSDELRLVALDTSLAVKELIRIPNPYRGFFAAATPAPEEIWIAGPVQGRTDADPVVVTLLLRVRIECRRDMR